MIGVGTDDRGRHSFSTAQTTKLAPLNKMNPFTNTVSIIIIVLSSHPDVHLFTLYFGSHVQETVVQLDHSLTSSSIQYTLIHRVCCLVFILIYAINKQTLRAQRTHSDGGSPRTPFQTAHTAHTAHTAYTARRKLGSSRGMARTQIRRVRCVWARAQGLAPV